MRKIIITAALLAIATPAVAQNVDAAPSYADLATLPVPVVEGDITDRPYRILGHLNKGVRKATMFSKSASHEKVYRELWEDAQKLGADAVIRAEYGQARVTALSWGSREARGIAVKFLTDAEIAALPQQVDAAPVVEEAKPAMIDEPEAALFNETPE